MSSVFTAEAAGDRTSRNVKPSRLVNDRYGAGSTSPGRGKLKLKSGVKAPRRMHLLSPKHASKLMSPMQT